MRKQVLASVLLPLLALAAESPFTGTWKVDPDKIQFPEKPESWLLQNGRYQCTSCVPGIDIKADGSDQPIPGYKFADTLAVKVVNDRTVEFTNKKGGKVVQKETLTVSADGKTLAGEFTQYREASKDPVTGKQSMTRVAAGAAGSHAISGSWRAGKVEAMSANALTFKLVGKPDGLTTESATGGGYDARFDGKEYPVKGDSTGTVVSLKKLNDRSIEETKKRDGKIVEVNHLTVSSDGKTMTIKVEDRERGGTTTVILVKQ
jgi:hypothetical protein